MVIKARLLILALAIIIIITGVLLNHWWLLVAGGVLGLLSAATLAADRTQDKRIAKKVTNWPGGWW